MVEEADIYRLFLGGPDAATQAQAMAEAIRRRREAAGQSRGLAMLTSLGANPLLAGINRSASDAANSLGQEAGQGEGMLAQAGSQGAGRALQEALAQRQAEQHAASLGMRQQELRESAAARREDRLEARTERQTLREIERQQKATAAAAAQAKAEEQLRVPGFERIPGAPGIRDVEASDMRAVVEGGERMEGLVSEVERLKIGTDEKPGTGREIRPFFNQDFDAQKAAASKLLLGIKDLEKTGALDQGTADVVEPLIPVPRDSADTSVAKLAQVRNLIATKLDAKAKSLGYRRAGGSAPTEDPAVRWARDNPSDPRARQILEANKAQ